jgi:hypothetical protein
VSGSSAKKPMGVGNDQPPKIVDEALVGPSRSMYTSAQLELLGRERKVAKPVQRSRNLFGDILEPESKSLTAIFDAAKSLNPKLAAEVAPSTLHSGANISIAVDASDHGGSTLVAPIITLKIERIYVKMFVVQQL